ncbi:MAG: flavodoxin [Planctomycetota bacterium]|nr:flavodoxin [Planctomycetota bacterium]
MKTLVVYYSRTGVTRKVAEALAEALGADIEQLIDTKKRGGALGFAVAVKDAAMKKLIPIAAPQKDPADYELVVVGTPVWADTICSAVRMYLTDYGKEIKRGAFFCTTHTSGIEKTLAAMQELAGCETAATASFRQKHVKRDEHTADLDAFVNALPR